MVVCVWSASRYEKTVVLVFVRQVRQINDDLISRLKSETIVMTIILSSRDGSVKNIILVGISRRVVFEGDKTTVLLPRRKTD